MIDRTTWLATQGRFDELSKENDFPRYFQSSRKHIFRLAALPNFELRWQLSSVHPSSLTDFDLLFYTPNDKDEPNEMNLSRCRLEIQSSPSNMFRIIVRLSRTMKRSTFKTTLMLIKLKWSTFQQTKRTMIHLKDDYLSMCDIHCSFNNLVHRHSFLDQNDFCSWSLRRCSVFSIVIQWWTSSVISLFHSLWSFVMFTSFECS